MSIARTRVQAGETTAWHYLKESVERYVLLEGRGGVEVGDLEPAHESGERGLYPGRV